MKRRKFNMDIWISKRRKEAGKDWLPKEEYYRLREKVSELDNEFHSIVSKCQ